MEREKRLILPAVLCALVFIVLLACVIPWFRTAVALVFCMAAPGSGWSLLFRLRDAGDRVAIAVLLSISLTVIVATGLIVADLWNFWLGFAILAVIALLGILCALARRDQPTPAVHAEVPIRQKITIEVRAVSTWEAAMPRQGFAQYAQPEE